jgi:succinate dehydrogenase/fumarate reductase flavoprotein subunit
MTENTRPKDLNGENSLNTPKKGETTMSSTEKEQKRITRREFVKGAAVGAAGVAAAGALASCAQQATPCPTPVPCPTEAPCPTAAPCPTVAPSAAGVPETWDKETDVVVAGTGGTGLAAAIEAKTAGADVLVLEKNDWIGGLFIASGGHAIIGGPNLVFSQEGIEDDLESWYEDELKCCEYRGVPELIRTYVEKGPEFMLWMEQLGFKWQVGGRRQACPGHRVNRSQWPGPSPNYPATFGHSWITVLEREVERLGVPILLEHRLTRIYRPDRNGPVVGVKVDTPEGTINIKARKGVILCTGTWTDNYRMAQAWDPRIVGPDCYGDGGIPSEGTLLVDSAGDGHLAAAEIGAGFSDMSFVSYYYIFYGSRSYWGWEPPDFTEPSYKQSGKGLSRGNEAMFQRVILVKSDGARWINEMEGAKTPREEGPGIPPEVSDYTGHPYWPYPRTFLSLPQPRNVWCVTDADGVAALEWPEDEMRNPDPKVGAMFDPALVAIADTLEELASQMDIPADALQATVDRYNGFVDAGVDEDFGKPMPMYKIATPPFFAAKAILIRHTQRNGLRVNTKSQVIEQSDQRDGYSGVSEDKSVSIDAEKVIPHLYAAGELADVVGYRRPHGSLGPYVIFGRIAGENAAKETSWG